MVARPGTYQASINAGELAPEMHGRTDVKQFYAGLALALNVEAVPQGGGRLSPRSRHLGRVRNTLQAIAPASSVIALGPHAVGAVIYTLNFNGAPGVSVVTLPGFKSNFALGAVLQVEWFDGTTWASFAQAFTVGISAVDRTIARPPRAQVLARAIRLRLISAPAQPTTFTAPSMNAFSETTTKPDIARVRPFTFGLDQTYTAVQIASHMDFYRDGVFVGSASTSFASDKIAAVKAQQRFDTMLLWHEDVKSKRILRNGADNEWVGDDIPYEAIPRVDLGGVYTNQIADEWKIYFRFPTTGTYAAGINLFLSLNVSGEETPGIPTGPAGGGIWGANPNWATFETAVKAAIEALPSQSAGVFTNVTQPSAGIIILTIRFESPDNIGQPNTMSAQVVNTSEAAATSTHTVIGIPGGEDLFSTSAGWAATGNFYQERLVIGGFRSKRGALLASVTGSYYNNNVNIISPTGAILANLDTDGAERLHHIARARHLVLFTTDAEYYISDRVLSRTTTPTIVNCSRNGSAPNVPIVESENSLLYVSRDGNLLYAATYDDVSQSYVSQPLSLLASHISRDIVDMALQKPTTDGDAGRLWQVRQNGTMTVGIMLRNQDVTAFVRWETLGSVKSACIDGVNIPHILVERSVGGSTELHLERLELGLIFDATVKQTFPDPITVIPNLEMHEGAEVWAVADGYTEGPFTVAGGAIELPEASSVVSVGRWTRPRAIPLPLPSEVTERIVVKRPKRVHTVRIGLINTTSVAIGANGRAPKDVALARAGDPVDVPQTPVTREEIISGLAGFSPEGQIEITQLKPGLLQWTGFTREART